MLNRRITEKHCRIITQKLVVAVNIQRPNRKTMMIRSYKHETILFKTVTHIQKRHYEYDKKNRKCTKRTNVKRANVKFNISL